MSRVDSKEVVESFLLKAHNILNSKTFDIRKHFYFQRMRTKYIPNNKHTNQSTMLALNFNVQDIVNELKSLTIKHYRETVDDNLPGRNNPFYCFVKQIQNRQVYIKFKISEVKNNQVFCISFHFVEFYVSSNEFPYC